MKKLSKKSKIFAFGLVLILLLVLLRVFFLVNARKADLADGDAEIGENQMNLYRAIQNADMAMLYGDEAFSLSFQQSVYDISEGGGYYSAQGCGEFEGVNVWRLNSTRECYPEYENVKNQISQAILSMLRTYLEKSPYPSLSEAEHEIFLQQKDGKLIGRAYALLAVPQNVICKYRSPPILDFGWFGVLDIVPDTEGMCGRYYYKPDFRKEVNFDMEDFNRAVAAAKSFSDAVKKCKLDGGSGASCVDDELKNYPQMSKEQAQAGDNFTFSYNPTSKVMAYDNGASAFGIWPVKIKFALYFPEEPKPAPLAPLTVPLPPSS